MIRFRWLPACVLAMLMTAGVCWGQKETFPQSSQPADTTRLPYYYELVDVLFPAVEIQQNNQSAADRFTPQFHGYSIYEAQDEPADASADECNDECCDDCAAEWIPILVDDCMKMWTLLWELGSYTEAAHLADEAWRLDPCNIATMHARTLSHLALAFNGKPTGDCPAQPVDHCLKGTLKVSLDMGCYGFGFACSGPTGPATTCTLPINACGMGCANASGCTAPCTTSCQPAKPTACEACSDCSAACTGSTCAASACCDQPTACGTCASSPCSKTCGHGCSASCSGTCESCCSEAKCCTGSCACKCACAKDCKCCCCKTACAKDCKCCCSGKCCCAKNACACQETVRVLLDRIIALVKESDSKAANVLVLPPGVAPHPMMAMPGMPGMCVPPPPPPMAAAGQPMCMPGMPCPGMPVCRPMEAATAPQPIPRAPVPPLVVGEILANPPMIPVRKDDMPIHVTPHGKRIHVSCKGFEAQCDNLTTCDGGERIVLEGKVRLTMQTGNKPGKVSAERVEVYVPEGSVELVPDSTTTEKPVEPVRYQCPVCPPPAYAVPN